MSVDRGAVAEIRARTQSSGIGIARFTREPYRRGRLRIREDAATVVGMDVDPNPQLSPGLRTHLDDYAEYLRLERGRSEHTVRAYLADVRSLLEYGTGDRPDATLADLDLRVLRGWLGGQAAAGVARTTLARRTSSARGSPGGRSGPAGWRSTPGSGSSRRKRTARSRRSCARNRRPRRWPPRSPVPIRRTRSRCGTG